MSKLSESGASNGTTDETKTTNTGSNATLAGNSSSPANKSASQKHGNDSSFNAICFQKQTDIHAL